MMGARASSPMLRGVGALCSVFTIGACIVCMYYTMLLHLFAGASRTSVKKTTRVRVHREKYNTHTSCEKHTQIIDHSYVRVMCTLYGRINNTQSGHNVIKYVCAYAWICVFFPQPSSSR